MPELQQELHDSVGDHMNHKHDEDMKAWLLYDVQLNGLKLLGGLMQTFKSHWRREGEVFQRRGIVAAYT